MHTPHIHYLCYIPGWWVYPGVYIRVVGVSRCIYPGWVTSSRVLYPGWVASSRVLYPGRESYTLGLSLFYTRDGHLSPCFIPGFILYFLFYSRF